MKKEDIFVGTIKQCLNVYGYKNNGDSAYVKEMVLGSMSIGTRIHYTEKITSKAILIKYDEERYIWLNALNSLQEDLLVTCGFPVKVIKTTPEHDKDLFVDTSCPLVPYYKKDLHKRTNVMRLRKEISLDPRIPGGIKH